MKTTSRHIVEIEVGIPIGVQITVVGESAGRTRLRIIAENTTSPEKAQGSIVQLLGWIAEEISPAVYAEYTTR